MLSKCGFIKVFSLLGLLWAGSSCPVSGAEWKTLPGHVPWVTSRLATSGELSATNELRLAIGLPLRDPAGLEKFLAAVANPASPNFRHYLTPEEFTSRFGPTEADYEAVKKFAAANSFTITATHGNRLLLDVTADAAKVEHAFHLHLQKFQHPREAREFFAPDLEPSVEVTLPIADVAGLSDYARPRAKLQHAKTTTVAGMVTPKSGSGPGGGYLGKDIRAAYVPGTALTGAGQMLGLLQFDGFYPNDIVAYENLLPGQPRVPLQTVLLDGFNGQPGSGNDEVSLDIEMAIAMAPGLAKIVVFEAPALGGQPNDILNAMAANSAIKNFSCSWGWGGNQNATTENIFKQMIAQGQSFFNASGDNAAFTPGQLDDPNQQNSPSASPNITQVGGTTLTMNGPGNSYASEVVWNDGMGTGSSGGISTANSLPAWQQGISMTANHGSTAGRNVPDVALLADNVYIIYGNGKNGAFIGTSISAPLWAGFMALVNQQADAWGYPSAGFINPAIYALGESADYSLYFHDTTVGNNFWSSSPNNFPATTGFDLCTGWGTPRGTNLINALAAFNPAANVVDTVPPRLTITSPVNNLRWSNTLFTVSGTASDNVAVSNVFYSLNGTGWTAATTTNSWGNWSADVTLNPGTNLLQAYAQDTSGNFSTTNQVGLVCILNVSLTVNTNGRGSFTPNYNGALLPVGATCIMTATPSTGFKFTGWTESQSGLVTNGATLKWTMTSNLVFTANFVDSALPTNGIVLPAANQRWSNSVFNVTGRAGDNVSVDTVFYSLNGFGWFPATTTNSWTNWTAAVTLTAGTNLLQAYAQDSAGNLSATSKVSLIYVVSAPLTINTNGRGSFAPNYNGAWLQLGVNYTLTAAAALGFKFVNWTDKGGNAITNGATLLFNMATDSAFTANFVDIANPTNGITWPVANQRLSNSLFTVSGKAGDNVTVTNVFYSLNAADWTNAVTLNGWSNWTAGVTLTPGTNMVQSYAVDSAGNLSTTNKITFVYVVNTPLTVQTNGRGTVSPNYNGAPLQLGANYTLTATAATGFKFLDWMNGDQVATNGSMLVFSMASNLVFTANFVDNARPTNGISSPVAGQHWSNSVFIVTGKAGDNVGVSNVYYSLNHTDWIPATTTNNWTNWTSGVGLTPGANVVQTYAVDSAGNLSATNTVSFIYVLSAPLTLSTNGRGTISPNYNGAWLQVGANYTLTATAATGCKFTNWTDGASNVITNSLALTFTMASNLNFTANFVDITKPTLTVIRPLPNQISTNCVFTVNGKASDNVGVTSVFYSLNGADPSVPTTSDNWSNWTAQVNLVPGTNVIRAWAVDAAGNISATNQVACVYVFALGGVWNMVQFQTPAQMTWDMNNGLVGGGLFAETNGTISFFPDGTLSGQFEDPFIGTYVISSNGIMVTTIVTASATNYFNLAINAALDTMTLLNAQFDAQNNQQELIVFERAPVTNTYAAMAGLWNAFQLQTPAQTTWNSVAGLQGGNNFSATNGSLVLYLTGAASGNLGGVFSGSYAVVSNGVVNLVTSAGGQTNAHTLFVNAGRTMMSLVEGPLDTTDNGQQLTLFQKAPALVYLSDVVGSWNVLQFQTPQALTWDAINGLLGGGNFGAVQGTIKFNLNGTVGGNLNGAVTGTYRAGSGGVINVSLSLNGQAKVYPLFLNYTKDTLTGVSSGQNRQQLLLLQRAAGN